MAYTTHGGPTRHPTTSDTNHPGSSGITNHGGATNHPASSGGSPPAVPTLTAPAAGANVFNTIAVTVSATTTDTPDRVDFVLDPGGSEVIVATDNSAPYSQSWTPTGVTDGAHTLVARSVNAFGSTNSASITINVGEVLHTLVTSVTCLRAWQSDFQCTASSWTDQKNGVPALQGTGANQPGIIANAIGTRTAVRFDGSNDFMRDATITIPQPGTTPTFMWFVFTPITWVINKTICSSGTTAGTFQCFQSVSTPTMAGYDGTVTNSNNGAVVGTPTRGEVRWSNSTSDYLKLGSTTQTGVSFGNLASVAGWNIGAVSTGASACNFDLYAMLLFSGVPSGAELAALSSAAAAMYPGLAV